MEVLETVCPLILLLSFVSDIGRIFGAGYVFLILIILIWSQSLTRRTAEYFEHTGHDTWSRLVGKIRRLCQFQLGAVAGSFIVSLLVALMSHFLGDSFKDLALVLRGTFGIPLLAAVFYSLYGASSAFSVSFPSGMPFSFRLKKFPCGGSIP